MTVINEIYKVQYWQQKFYYAGTLRNEKRFEINDNIFVAIGSEGEIFRAKIIGVELPPDENPEFKYKVKLPTESVNKRGEFLDETYENITCERIFNSWEEAKESAVKHLERKYKNQMAEIERYFEQFDEGEL